MKKYLIEHLSNCIYMKKLIRGKNLDVCKKNIAAHSIKCAELRDEGGLASPFRITVLIMGIIIKLFERFIS